ncbi:unnamed protein product [Rodentolepis nana]|uniref:Alpha-mann_mid domain-containing protein n=1 Tax=Rodentolepis nana TaxID=102285 RepID=A0A0R3U049_RODNA|nr:unnamed protein product [Rodentolepis nana]
MENVIDPKLTKPNVSTIAEVDQLGPLEIKTSIGQQRTLENLVKEFKRAMSDANLNGQRFLHAEALLGSIQHHDFIPWDDDADFKLHIKHRQAVQTALKKLAPRLHTYAMWQRDKLYFAPFNSSILLTPYTIGSHSVNRYNLGDIFPLAYRPLGKEWLPVPRRPISFLKSYYGNKVQVCKSQGWSHATESASKLVVVDCRKLMDKYPFVHQCRIPEHKSRRRQSGMCDEYLVNGSGQVFHKIRLPLDVDECESSFYTVRHESFRCHE